MTGEGTLKIGIVRSGLPKMEIFTLKSFYFTRFYELGRLGHIPEGTEYISMKLKMYIFFWKIGNPGGQIKDESDKRPLDVILKL